MKKLTSIVLMCIMTLDSGCGTWIGNPDKKTDSQAQGVIQLNLKAITSTALLSGDVSVISKSGSSLGTISLTEAKIALKDIKLELGDTSTEEDSASDTDFEGPYVLDLLTNTATPNPGEATIPAGFYKKINISIAKLEQDKADEQGMTDVDQLIDKSIYLVGTFTNLSGATKSFTMSFKLDEEFELTDGSNGINIATGDNNPLIIAFALTKWFDFSGSIAENSNNIDLSDISSSSIVLSEDAEGTEKELHKLIKENIKKSADFAKDKDNDGEIESEDKESEDGA